MAHFADVVAGQIRAQQYAWADGFMGRPFIINISRHDPKSIWPKAKTQCNDWNLFEEGFTWRGMKLCRGKENACVPLGKREKKLLHAAWKLAREIERIRAAKIKAARNSLVAASGNVVWRDSHAF